MTKLLRRFMLCRQGVTAIEYALLGSGVALVIVTRVGTAGTQSQRKLHPYRRRVSMKAAGAQGWPDPSRQCAFANRQVTA